MLLIVSFFKLFEAADIIQKLQLVAQELPSSKFNVAQKLIGQKYDEIERALIEEFAKAHIKRDRTRMKHIAGILSHFKGYSQCIDAFIEQSQSVLILSFLKPLCNLTYNLIYVVGSFRQWRCIC